MERILVLGYGPVGAAIVQQATGRSIRVAQRRLPEQLPTGVEFMPCDVLDEEALVAACRDVQQIVLAVGFAYDRAKWRADWPRAMANVLSATEKAGARLVFVDNLYMYGPQTSALREDMALQDYGAKPAVRAAITRLWMAAHEAGRARVAALRASDFFGPGTLQSHLGAMGLAALAKGKPAMLVVDPDQRHDFAYVPDIARAVLTLLDAHDADFGQAWHVPHAPTRTPREIFSLGAAAAGVPLRLRSIPMPLLPALGLFNPFLREMAEMRFQWDRTYQVDSTKFARRFWADATPIEIAVPATIRAFQSETLHHGY